MEKFTLAPMLNTQTSSGAWASASRRKAVMSSSLRASSERATTRPPAASISATSGASFSPLRLPANTLKPSAANFFAIAAPMKSPAPITAAVACRRATRCSDRLFSRVAREPRARPDRGGNDNAISRERRAEREKHAGEFAGPSQHEPAAADGKYEPREAGNERPQQASRSLRREIKREPQAEAPVERPEGARMGGAGGEHRRVAVEQREPRDGKRGREKPDRFREQEGDGGADPGDAQRALAPARADVGADERDERRPEPEREGDEQIFEARADAVAGDGGGAVRADEPGGDADREICHDRRERRHRADLQDVAEHRPAQAHDQFRP